MNNVNRTVQAMVAKSIDTFGMDRDKYLLHLLFPYRTKQGRRNRSGWSGFGWTNICEKKGACQHAQTLTYAYTR